MVAGFQSPMLSQNNQSAKKTAEAKPENKQLKTTIMESANEMERLKATIIEMDFENRILKTKIAAVESEKNHLQARVDEFDIIKTEQIKSAEQAGKNAPVNTLTDPQAISEITYLNNKINKQKNLKGWMSLGIVLLITAVVLFFLNAAYKI